MASKQTTLVHVDEDYIDMELNTSSNFFTYTISSSPPKSREFEFQMNCISNEKDSTPSPADDLFYKGKLLPLHLPPRLQMVQKLLVENPNLEEDNHSLRIPSKFVYTPLESCNFPISESCRVSSEVNPDEYSFVWSSSSKMSDIPNKSLPKKLKQMKQFSLSQKLKASRIYLKSLFSKSGCSNKSSATTAKRNNPFEIFNDVCDKNNNMKQNLSCVEDDFINHRKSFSGVVQRHCGGIKSSSLSTSSSGSSSNSSSFSFSSSGYYDLQLFKRSISANYELEGSVEGAIAHCKMSQKQHCSSKNILDDDARICSQFAKKIEVCGNEESLSSTSV